MGDRETIRVRDGRSYSPYRHIKTEEVVYLREPRTVSSYGLTVLVDATNEPFNRLSVVPV